MPSSPDARRSRPARSGRTRRTSRALAGTVLIGVALTACSGEGPSLPTERPTLSLPSPTLPTLPTLPSVTLPTLPSVTLPTLPTVTLPTLPTGTAEPSPEPTADPTPDPTPEATAAPTLETTPEETATSEDAATDDEATDDEATVDEEGGSWWPWLLLLTLLAGAVVGAVALIRRRRERAAWSAAVEEILPEAVWLRDSIVPDLLDEGPDGRAGIWVVSRPRVVALERQVQQLAAEAPEPADARSVGALATAVEAVRRLLDQADVLVHFGGPSVTAALHRSHAELDEAITALQPPQPPEEDAPASTEFSG